MMSVRTNRLEKILVSRGVHPNYREVLHTYAWAGDFEIVEVDTADGLTNPDDVKKMMDDSTGAVVIQSPHFFGAIEDISAISALTEGKKTNLITAVAEAMSLGMLKGPGEMGADIVCGEVQSFGNYQNFGGPFVGYISTRNEFARKIPGRLIGKTLDADGNMAFALTLQTREQHIRREKATSNICTNQGLMALRSAIYLSLVGNRLKEISELNHNKASYLKEKLEQLHVDFPFKSPFFNEFVVRSDRLTEVSEKLRGMDLHPGLLLEEYYPELKNCMLVCVTEMTPMKTLEEFASCF